MDNLVFVYGTLRKGEVNHFWLDGAMFVGQYTIPSGWHMIDLGPYPAVIADKVSFVPIIGEIYQVTPAILEKLDELEEYPTLYGREQITTKFGLAWIYYYQHIDTHLIKRIESGDWCQRMSK